MATNTPIETCPRCQEPTEKGFCHRANGLSFVSAEKLNSFVSIDEDLAKAGLLRKFLPSKAEFYSSFLCRSCNLYVLDYGTSLSSAEAKALASTFTSVVGPQSPN